jgi:hypothetical protein
MTIGLHVITHQINGGREFNEAEEMQGCTLSHGSY